MFCRKLDNWEELFSDQPPSPSDRWFLLHIIFWASIAAIRYLVSKTMSGAQRKKRRILSLHCPVSRSQCTCTPPFLLYTEVSTSWEKQTQLKHLHNCGGQNDLSTLSASYVEWKKKKSFKIFFRTFTSEKSWGRWQQWDSKSAHATLRYAEGSLDLFRM